MSTTNQTIIRHLKGIIAALEKEEQGEITFRGIAVRELTDEKLRDAWRDAQPLKKFTHTTLDSITVHGLILSEAKKRNIDLFKK
jgi:hypothetical protein